MATQQFLIYYYLLFNLWLVQTFGAPILDNDGHETTKEELQNTTNWFIDDVMDAFRESIGPKIDPLILPRQSMTFEKDLFLFSLKGEAALSESVLVGLSRFKRTSDALMGPHPDNGQMSVAVLIGVDDLWMRSKLKLAFMGLGFNSDLNVKIRHLEVGVESYLKAETGKPVFDDIKVTKLDGIDVTLPTFGLLSKLANLVTAAFVTLFKSSLKSFIEDTLKQHAHKALTSNNNIFSK